MISITLPVIAGVEDQILTDASDGHLTLARAYDFKRNKQPLVTCYCPRNSFLLWKYLHSKLVTDSLLRLYALYVTPRLKCFLISFFVLFLVRFGQPI